MRHVHNKEKLFNNIRTFIQQFPTKQLNRYVKFLKLILHTNILPGMRNVLFSILMRTFTFITRKTKNKNV